MVLHIMIGSQHLDQANWFCDAVLGTVPARLMDPHRVFWRAQRPRDHARWQSQRSQRKFTAVNTLIGNFKTAITGTYHAAKFIKYAYRFLSEVQFPLNRRYEMCATRQRPNGARRYSQAARGRIRVAEIFP